MNNVVVDAAAAVAAAEAAAEAEEETNFLCINCDGVINENTYCILFDCDHGIHVNCLDEYMENERTLCSECSNPIERIEIIKNNGPPPMIYRRLDYNLDERATDISKLYNEDKEYKNDIDNCNKLLVKIKKIQNKIYGKPEIAKKKEISAQSKFYKKIIQKRKLEFIKSIKKEKEKECKELRKLCNQFRPTNISKCSFAADRFTFQATICGAKPRELPL